MPVLIVNYDQLISNPADKCAEIGRFIGEGNWEAAAARVDPDLKRSAPEENPEINYGLADRIYRFINAGNWPAVLDTCNQERSQPVETESMSVLCTRLGRRVMPEECAMCKNHEQTRANFIKTAAGRKIDWAGEPCLRDVVDGAATIEGSIADNHWLKVIQ